MNTCGSRARSAALAVSCSLLAASVGLAQPANDLCSNAEVVGSLPAAIAGSNVGATGANESSCAGTGDTKDVWYRFTPAAGGLHVVDTNGSGLADTSLAIFAACSGTQIACSDDEGTDAWSLIELNASAGTPYLIRVAGYGGAEGAFVLNIAPPLPALSNDECSAAIAIGVGSTAGANIGATGSDITSCAFDDTKDVWYAFTPAASGSYLIDTNGGSGTTADTALALFSGCGGAEMECNDDGGLATRSRLNPTLTAGVTYYVRYAGYDDATGTFTINVAGPLTPAPNDDCAAATVAVVGANPVNNVGATGLDITSCAGNDTRDSWLRFVAPATDNYVIDTEGTTDMDDTTLAVFDGCGGTQLACNDDGGTGNLSMLTLATTAGATYYIRFSGYTHSVGYGTVNIAGPNPSTGGACCTGTACSIVAGAGACASGSYGGDASTCSADPLNPTTCCRANFDATGGINVADIFSFLSAWFVQAPAADFNNDAVVNVSDIFVFLSAWFAGC